MNTPTIVRTTRTEWLRRGIAITGALLISGAVALGLANRAAINSTPDSPAASVSAAQERYAAFKQHQAEQVADAAMPLPPVQISARERYLALKDRQAEQHDMTVVPAPATVSARERYLALKDRQAEMRDVGSR
jgi:hypothetical protein